jgi:hypothetical protein
MAQFFTLEEAARVLGMSSEELEVKAQTREVRAFLEGGSWRFRVVDIDQLARRRGLGSDAELRLSDLEVLAAPGGVEGEELDPSDFELTAVEPDQGAEAMHIGQAGSTAAEVASEHDILLDDLSLPAEPVKPVTGSSLIIDLKRESEALSRENARLRARVAELALSQKQSRVRRRRLRERLHEFEVRLDERAKANDRMQSALIARIEGRLRMCESYQGEVVDVDGDRVVVVYDVKGDVIEQVYERSQFLEGRLPEVGTVLTAYVMAAEVAPQVGEPVPVEDERDDNVPSYRRKPLDEPTIF